jgi:hypothetical protein
MLMICMSCGTKNINSTQYCFKCGSAVTGSPRAAEETGPVTPVLTPSTAAALKTGSGPEGGSPEKALAQDSAPSSGLSVRGGFLAALAVQLVTIALATGLVLWGYNAYQRNQPECKAIAYLSEGNTHPAECKFTSYWQFYAAFIIASGGFGLARGVGS